MDFSILLGSNPFSSSQSDDVRLRYHPCPFLFSFPCENLFRGKNTSFGYDFGILSPRITQAIATDTARNSCKAPDDEFCRPGITPVADDNTRTQNNEMLKAQFRDFHLQITFHLRVRDIAFGICATTGYKDVYFDSCILRSFGKGQVQIKIDLSLGLDAACLSGCCSQGGKEYCRAGGKP